MAEKDDKGRDSVRSGSISTSSSSSTTKKSSGNGSHTDKERKKQSEAAKVQAAPKPEPIPLPDDVKALARQLGYYDKGEKDLSAEERSIIAAMQGYDKIGLPTYNTNDFVSADYVGDVETQLASAAMQGDSELRNIKMDPALRDAQLGALDRMQQIGNSNGLLAEDVALLNKQRQEAALADRGRREAILSNNQARGLSGSGNELLAQLSSSQAATQRQNQAGLDIAGMAQKRAIDAIERSGQLGGQIRGQDWSEAAQRAAAQDAINQFNAASTTQNNQFNAGQTNNMGQFNAGARQAQANVKANTANQSQTYQNSLQQQQFQNQTGIAGAKSDLIMNPYRKAQVVGGGGGGGSDLAGAGALMTGTGALITALTTSDERVKHDIDEVDEKEIDEFLSALNPKEYKYNGSDQDKIGFMLQDIEDTKLGDKLTLKDENGLRHYDPQNLQGIMLAAIKRLSEKKD